MFPDYFLAFLANFPENRTSQHAHGWNYTSAGDAEIARPDIARLDNVRPCSKGGHRET